MTTPTTTNAAATDVNKLISALDNAGVQAVEAMIMAQVPWLALPIIKPIWEIPFSWVASYFTQAAQQGVTFAVVDVQVDVEQSGISKTLAALVSAEKTGDQNAIQLAIKNYQATQSALINDNGSASS